LNSSSKWGFEKAYQRRAYRLWSLLTTPVLGEKKKWLFDSLRNAFFSAKPLVQAQLAVDAIIPLIIPAVSHAPQRFKCFPDPLTGVPSITALMVSMISATRFTLFGNT
jgi:hypothetical protein